MVREHDTSAPRGYEVVDFIDVYRQLELQLRLHNQPASHDLLAVLECGPQLVDHEVVMAEADVRLQEIAEETAARRAPRIADETLSVYPDAYLSESLITPHQYIRANNLDQNRRHLLARAKVEAVEESSQELQSALHEDEQEYQQYDHGIDAAALQLGLVATAEEVRQEVDDIIAAIQAEMPPQAVAFKWVLDELGLGGNPGLAGGWRNANGEVVDARQGSYNAANVNRLMGSLTDIAEGVAESSEYITQRLVERSKATVEANVIDYIKGRYEQLAVIAADQRLPVKLDQAYAAAAGQDYTYVSQRERERQASSMPQVTLELPVQESSPAANGDFEIDAIGSIESPFPWLPDTKLHMQLVSGCGQNILFCEALSPAAQSITNTLRRESMTRKMFDSLRERFLRIEITDPNARHNHIQRLNGTLGEQYKGLIINKFGNVGANAKRVYYVKTNVDRYPETAALATEYGLPETTTLLVLVGETDKAHQLKLLGSFGIDRVAARNQNAGSV